MIPVKTATILSVAVGIVNLVLLYSAELSERAYSWLLVGILNLLIAPGVYLSIALNIGDEPWAMLFVIFFNMAVYFAVGEVWSFFWQWVRKTA